MIVDQEKENKEIAKQYKELLRISYQTLSDSDKKMIRLAFDMAVEAHSDQRRKSGEAYIFHPISVAKIVANQIGLDATSICAALLHDVVEDTRYSLQDIERLLGVTVAKIVHGLTKISSLKKDKNISLQAENFRKMLLTLNDDVRVIIIKIADRLHNMQTMDAMPEYKQVKIASETLYIYAPLAHRIGLYNVKTELEDLSLKYTEPQRFQSIKGKIEETKESQEAYIKSFSKFLTQELSKERFKFEIKGRSKSIYSIHRKMQTQNVPFEKIYDKFALRIIYKANRNNEKFLAWKIYSIATDHFTPNPTRLRDWISAPKSTGYEALHITVMGPSNKWIEIQIRSERMHEIAEKGYAAHYKYKQGDQKDIGIESWLNRLQEVLENNTGNAVDFVEDFKLNLYAKEIFVFTPKGDLKSLPQGATALDFAFFIHSEIGIKTRGVRVNDKLVPLSKVLKSGDQIEIITSDHIKPSSNWLDFVVTSRARSIIKSSINEEKKAHAEEGKEILRRKLKPLKISLNDKTTQQMLHYFKFENSQDLFYRVGIGTLDNKKLKEFANEYHNTLLNFFKRRVRKNKPQIRSEEDKITEKFDKLVFGKEKEPLAHSFASCCHPIPGDAVFGFITVNEGIKVHHKECPNALSLQSNFAYRVIPAKWVDSSAEQYNAILKLSGIDKKGLVNEVTRMISNNTSVNINKINFDTEDSFFTGLIHVSVPNKNTLNKLVNTLSRVNGIDKIVRE
ncbi:MAG: RelA/SpoT family protein [Flavobacteriaceae bacterium]|jgi:GTP diphosphokinase / guanosine-3',5'-bis(diphosphate) 3'-diphosphatase|nr:RelA/SpoT family protein [Flavobacteriaceae bacterium]MDG1920990.1 RelA/SpoT family protein [Flavobacteriaceae bacterium]